MELRIKQVAELSGTTVRTLHHYHEIGLLQPDRISEAGYRLYSHRSLLRLRQILFLKELDFSLKDIKVMLDDDLDEVDLLMKQKQLLKLKIKRLNRILTALDDAITEKKGDQNMYEIFKPLDKTEIDKMQRKYAKEVRERYGKDVVEECNKKVASYDNEKWQDVLRKMGHLITQIADCMDQPPNDEKVQQLIKGYRAHITESFYECTPQIFRGLGELYVLDDRFKAFFEKVRVGLAQYMKEAITYYCDHI